MLRKGGQVRTALCEKTKIDFQDTQLPRQNFLDPPMHHKCPNPAISIQYCSIVSGTPIHVCLFRNSQKGHAVDRWGWGGSHELVRVEPDRAE